MRGTYVMEAIPPYCKERRTRVEVVRWLGDRVLLRDLEWSGPSDYLIETGLSSFEPDIEPIPNPNAGIAPAYPKGRW